MKLLENAMALRTIEIRFLEHVTPGEVRGP
jgi:hypothetical protein